MTQKNIVVEHFSRQVSPSPLFLSPTVADIISSLQMCCLFPAFTLGTNSVRFLVRTKCLCHAFSQLVLLAQHNQHHCVSGGDGCYGTAGQT